LYLGIAMKKSSSRLALKTQTLRTLSATELVVPRGGQSDPGAPSGGDPGRPTGDPGLPASHDGHCTAAPPSHP